MAELPFIRALAIGMPAFGFAAVAACAQDAATAARESSQDFAPPAVYDVIVENRLPHDVSAFTQGLFFAEGALYESTGQYGESVIRRVNMQTGAAVAETRLPDEIFGEGAAAVGDRIISLSWKAGVGFVHDRRSLERLGTFEYAGEGWGLAYDGVRLILSDGTDRLRFLDPETFEETGALAVTYNGRPLQRINELEWIEGEIWANIWMEDVIVRIDPETGRVVGVVDLSGLMPPALRANPYDDVANGIAYEPTSKRLFVTGKRWPALFEITLRPRP
ncbi:MAG: glutaminyl-peptide cyclotransferase [Parvularculaceae bacterium]